VTTGISLGRNVKNASPAEGIENMALVDALAGVGVDAKAAVHGAGNDLEPALGVLLRRAQEAGAVRADAELDDLLVLCASACRAAGRNRFSPARSQRITQIIADGLRA
jgi:hypothetical protein